ncbi:MAG: futalosine hydrolase [Thermodesulfovibrionia bacterium]|nr:futalosine hydrolase [Thermodesulfovibrionia bacterium]
MGFLAILVSMSFESDNILAHLKRVRTKRIAGKTIYRGKLSDSNVIVMHTGIGKVNAAHAATVLIEHFPLRRIINAGVGGAYPQSGLHIGDIAIATKEINGDEGAVTSGGWKGIKETGIPLVQIGKKKYFNEFPLDNTFFKRAFKSFKRITHYLSRITRVKSGAFVTVSTSTGTHTRAVELEKRFKAICENMEGAAIAQICTLYNIPMFEIRGVSNIVGVRDKRKWNLPRASDNCQEAVLKMISSRV